MVQGDGLPCKKTEFRLEREKPLKVVVPQRGRKNRQGWDSRGSDAPLGKVEKKTNQVTTGGGCSITRKDPNSLESRLRR